MIKMMRVDDRLIHGQVAVMWSKELGIQRIIVASDSGQYHTGECAEDGCPGRSKGSYSAH